MSETPTDDDQARRMSKSTRNPSKLRQQVWDVPGNHGDLSTSGNRQLPFHECSEIGLACALRADEHFPRFA
jgi:hypothetical protein